MAVVPPAPARLPAPPPEAGHGAERGMRRNFLLTLAWDGTEFSGWQRLPPPARSVQAELEHALFELFGQRTEAVGAGRTDRGVHAEGQAASFHARTDLSCQAIAARLNDALPADMDCLSCIEVEPRFHARYRAVSKLYRYRLHVGPRPPAGAAAETIARRSLHVDARLDLAAMRATAAMLVGERDFRFLSNEKEKADTRRRLDAATVTERPAPAGTWIDLSFEAPGFLRNQVRVMAALVLASGDGSLGPDRVRALLESGQRAPMPGALPPQGLCLVEVRYPDRYRA